MIARATGFAAYPSVPRSVGEVVAEAISAINAQHNITIETWENLPIGGREIIDQVCAKIDRSDLFIADATGFNLNVLYELGFAIARNKKVWLLFDETVISAKWSDLRLLSGIGHRRSTNSADIVATYAIDRPHEENATLFTQHVQPILASKTKHDTILYLKSSHDTNANSRVSTRVEASAMRKTIDDPREVPSQPLAWYAQHVASAKAVLCHFDDPARSSNTLRNPALAFVAGLAHGLNKNVLLIGEGHYLAPLDYRDRMKQYQTATKAQEIVDEWLSQLENRLFESQTNLTSHKPGKKATRELSSVQLGEYVAENEGEGLVDGYFVSTMAYEEAIRGARQNMLFVGRKGAGKSANYLKLAAKFQTDKTKVVCEIRPHSYELSSLVELLARFVARDEKQFIIEGLWRFLLYTEILGRLVSRINDKRQESWTSKEHDLVHYRNTHPEIFDEDFAGRLEACVERLKMAGPSPYESLREFRTRVGKMFYAEAMSEMRERVVAATPPKVRICFLVDNLDKAWERQGDMSLLAEFLLGLLTAANKVSNDMTSPLAASRATLSLAVFLRADIFDRIRTVAREPDKIDYHRLEWSDPELLLRLLDERFEVDQGEHLPPKELWRRFFVKNVGNIETHRYVLSTILPRPRDLLYLTKTAISAAVNRRHSIVEESDILDAVKRYSEFAYDVLRIEESSYEDSISGQLIEFVGEHTVLEDKRILELLARGRMHTALPDDAIARLCLLWFLQIEVRAGEFYTVEDEKGWSKALVLAKSLSASRAGTIRYRVHPAFHAYLELISK